MHIYLYGPSGSGKSTVGKLLAQSLNLIFIDLDSEIEKMAGQIIPEIMAGRGEGAFRELEARALRNTTDHEDAVIALGGGALLREANRDLAHEYGQVVFLDTDFQTLSKRLRQDVNQRPLLAGDLDTSLMSLLDSRREHYTSFPLDVDASYPPEQVAWNIQKLVGRYHLRAMEPSYDAWVQSDGLDTIGERLNQHGWQGPIAVVSDSNVAPLYAERVQRSLQEAGYVSSNLVIPAGESHKNLESVSYLWRACLEANLDRKSTLIALGGGVVGDLTGFTAATFMRGCNWVAIPTTLLAMVDASLGGKTGFDLPEGKNLVGTFHPPRFVLADPEVLDTLPERELRSGLAEVLKHGVIADPALFDMCRQGWHSVRTYWPNVVKRAMAVKVKVIEEDPYEQGIRAGLNFGHTVGHAVELVSNFSLLHGEAVAIGMVAEARLAEKMLIAAEGLSDSITDVLLGFGLPVEIPDNLPITELIEVMKVDKKKSAGKLYFALPTKIGEVRVGVEVENLMAVFEEAK